MRRKCFYLLEVCAIVSVLPSASLADLTCEALLMLSGNVSLQSLAASWNQTLSNATSQWSGSGIYCDTSIDGIGTCWPRSSAGQMVSRPCPEMFYGVRYNTTNNVYRKCLANGTWALKGNYSMCKAILHEEKKGKMHYQIAVIINFLGHCISMVALLVAFFLFLCLRSIRCLRNIIHWNLITAFILRNATWFIVQLTMSPEVHESNVIWCRLVTASFNYFHSTNFFWMFGEGCYLHTAIVLTYSTDKLRKWMFICIGWCIPFPIIVAWAIGKLYYDNEKCWFGKRAGVYTDYIYQGPMILVLVLSKPNNPSDQLHFPLQHRENPDDQTSSLDHLRDHPVQESREGHAGAASSAGNHLHAVFREPGRRRDLSDRLHLLQLLPGVLPGLLCVGVLLLPKQRGALGCEEAFPPVAGAALDPSQDDPGHVHPHFTFTGQLPQHQAVHVALRGRGGGGETTTKKKKLQLSLSSFPATSLEFTQTLFF
uniref:Corticotropin releasing hormone receptor 1 n=1 Tax=Amphiprion percula TaxID=161767 RepID=A0A3P8RYK7_AMPPE